MADDNIDKQLIGQVLSSIPYDQVFGAPARAMCDSEIALAKSQSDFILNVGFEKDENGVNKTRYAEFEFEEIDGNNQTKKRKLKIPLILILNMPTTQVTEGTVSFDLEISQSASVKETTAAEGEASASLGWGPFSVSFKAKASYHRECARSTDTRARQHVEMKMARCPPPEAVSLLMEIMREAALGASSGKLPGQQNQLPDNQPKPEPKPEPSHA